MDNEYYEKRLKRLEETIMWLQRDLEILVGNVKNIQPEINYHQTNIIENITCKNCDEDDLFTN